MFLLTKNNYELLSNDTTTTPIWSFQLQSYGRYRFRLVARNEVGESEPYPLTIAVNEPIENFEIQPLNVTKTINAVKLSVPFKLTNRNELK